MRPDGTYNIYDVGDYRIYKSTFQVLSSLFLSHFNWCMQYFRKDRLELKPIIIEAGVEDYKVKLTLEGMMDDHRGAYDWIEDVSYTSALVTLKQLSIGK